MSISYIYVFNHLCFIERHCNNLLEMLIGDWDYMSTRDSSNIKFNLNLQFIFIWRNILRLSKSVWTTSLPPRCLWRMNNATCVVMIIKYFIYVWIYTWKSCIHYSNIFLFQCLFMLLGSNNLLDIFVKFCQHLPNTIFTI